MAPHSSALARKIPWTEEPGRLRSMGSLRVGHNWVTSLLLFTFMHWRRKWQPTPVFLPGESHGQRSLAGYSAWNCRVWHYWVTEHTRARARTHTHTQSVCWILTLQCDGFGKWLGHEGRTPMNGISVLIKEIPESSLTFSMWGHKEKVATYKPGCTRHHPHQTLNLLVPWSWAF